MADLRRLQYFVAVAAERNFTRSRPTSDGPARDADAAHGFFATAMTHDEPGSVEPRRTTVRERLHGVFTLRDGGIAAVREYMDTLYVRQRLRRLPGLTGEWA